MTLAANAYKIWKQQHTINLRVYTDEQMFEIGFEAGRQAGIAQEKALWELQQSTQEIEQKPTKKAKAK